MQQVVVVGVDGSKDGLVALAWRRSTPAGATGGSGSCTCSTT